MISHLSVLPSALIEHVGTRAEILFAAQWLVYAFPYRRVSPVSSRMSAHGSGPMWVATPSSQWAFTTSSLPV